MRVRFCCGDTRYEVEGEPVCGHLWEVDGVSPDEWVRDAVHATCPACGHTSPQSQAHPLVLDYGLPLAVVVCVRNETGRVLAVSRRNDPTAFGLPGGKVDPEDGPTDPESLLSTLKRAVAREVWEEVGVRIDPDEFWLEFHLPDASGFWNFCFEASAEAFDGASTQDGEGVTRWVDWEALERGPFGSYNQALRAHYWESERWLDPEATSVEEVHEMLRTHGGDPEAIGREGAAMIYRLLAELREE